MKKFENFHPVVLFSLFAAVIVPAVFVMDMHLSIIILISGMVYLWILNGKVDTGTIFMCSACVAAAAAVNMLVSHRGSSVILYINNKAITKEAMMYGIKTGLMLSTAFVWFMCMDKVVTGEKILCILRRMPKLALMLSMILRFIPGYIAKYTKVKEVHGQDTDRLKIMGGVLTYALENSMQTAESMEMRGFTRAEIIYGGYTFRVSDGLMLLLIAILVLSGVFVPALRIYLLGLLSGLPLIYRGKEAIKLWIYNLRK